MVNPKSRILTVSWLLALALALICMPTAVRADEPGQRQDAPQESKMPEYVSSLGGDPYAAMMNARKLVALGKPAVEPCIEATRDKNPQSRWWAASVLGRVRDERGRKRLVELLSGDPHPVVRSVAAWHLKGYIGAPGTVKALLGALKDPVPSVRGWAIRVLREERIEEALPDLKRLLEHPHPPTRYDALYALVVIMKEGRIELLKKVLAEDESAEVRKGALECVTVLNPPDVRGAEVLIQGLEDKEVEVRTAAKRLLLRGFDHACGFDPKAEANKRREAVRRWRAWYAANGDKLLWDAEKRCFSLRPKKKDAAGGG